MTDRRELLRHAQQITQDEAYTSAMVLADGNGSTLSIGKITEEEDEPFSALIRMLAAYINHIKCASNRGGIGLSDEDVAQLVLKVLETELERPEADQ